MNTSLITSSGFSATFSINISGFEYLLGEMMPGTVLAACDLLTRFARLSEAV